MSANLSKLQQTVNLGTDYWNDSCSIEELTYGISHGAVGATTNPQIVVMVIKKEGALWHERIRQIIKENPTWNESEITWKLVEEMAIKGAKLLEAKFLETKGQKGRLSIQTNPHNYRNAKAIAEQATYFNILAANMQVKAPVTKAGVAGIEEATYNGVSINATVSFTVPQMIAVGEAIERGLKRREKEGKDISQMSPVCTMMVGRLDDWIKVVNKRDKLGIDEKVLDWAGIAAFKKACELYKKYNFRTRPLVAAYRHLGHWSEFVGGDVVLTIPYDWAVKVNASDINVIPRMQNAVDKEILATLNKIPDFVRAYNESKDGGLTIDEFDSYGATVRTLRGFNAAVYELATIVREYMLPNPEV